MFYGMCMKCGDRWEIGDTPVCKCRKQSREASRDGIINMAAQAGISEAIWFYDHDVLEKFAALVAAHEREECAKVCDAKAIIEGAVIEGGTAQRCAAAIRARDET